MIFVPIVGAFGPYANAGDAQNRPTSDSATTATTRVNLRCIKRPPSAASRATHTTIVPGQEARVKPLSLMVTKHPVPMRRLVHEEDVYVLAFRWSRCPLDC